MFERRDTQMRVVDKAAYILSDHNNVVLDGPTGCGKSAIGYFLHDNYYKENTQHKSIILCHQKLLQDQYAASLSGVPNVMVLKGKSNYKCRLLSNLTVDNAPCQHTGRCRFRSDCEYFILRSRVPSVPLLITNYQMVLSLMEVGSYDRQSDIAIYDEFHNIPHIFTEYRKVSASSYEISYYEKAIKCSDKYSLNIEDHIETAVECLKALTVSSDYDDCIDILRVLYDVRILLSRAIKDILEADVNVLLKDANALALISGIYNSDSRFITKYRQYKGSEVEYVPDYKRVDEICSFSLTPISVREIASPIMEEISSRSMLMSSTPFKNIIEDIGIKQYNEIILPNPIPVENRTIIFNPIATFNTNNTKKGSAEFDKMCNTIIDIISCHNGDNGVIFTPSYNLASSIRQNIESRIKKLGYSILINYDADGRDTVIDSFRNSKERKKILLSPSFTEGVNFEDDISRFQIITKTPYKSLGDNYVKVKMERDKRWYEMDCILTMVQQAGRSVRHVDDYCMTYLLDYSSLRLYEKYEKNLPRWFNDAVKVVWV